MSKFYDLHESLIIENSFYTSGDNTARDNFIDDDINVKNCFWVTVLGFFGLMTLSNHAPKFKGMKTKEYLKQELKVRLTHITDDNNDLSLIIKIVADKGLLKPTTVNKLTRLLAKLKTGSIKSLDEDAILELLNEIIYNKLKPDMKLGKFVKPYLTGDIKLASILESLYTFATRNKICNEFKRVARPARATFKRLMVDEDTLDGSDIPIDDVVSPVVTLPPSVGIMDTKISKIMTQLENEFTYLEACVNIIKYAMTGGDLKKLPTLNKVAIEKFLDYTHSSAVITEMYTDFNVKNVVKYLPYGTKVSNIPQLTLNRFISAMFETHIKMNGTSTDFYSKVNADILNDFAICIKHHYKNTWSNKLHTVLWNKDVNASNLLSSIRTNWDRLKWDGDFDKYMNAHAYMYSYTNVDYEKRFSDADYDNILWLLATFNSNSNTPTLLKNNTFRSKLISLMTVAFENSTSLQQSLGIDKGRFQLESLLNTADINNYSYDLNSLNANCIITVMKLVQADTIDDLIANKDKSIIEIILSEKENDFPLGIKPLDIINSIVKHIPTYLEDWIINDALVAYRPGDRRFIKLAFEFSNAKNIPDDKWAISRMFASPFVIYNVSKRAYFKLMYDLLKLNTNRTADIVGGDNAITAKYLIKNINEPLCKDCIEMIIDYDLVDGYIIRDNVIGLAMRSNNKKLVLDMFTTNDNAKPTPRILRMITTIISWLTDEEVIKILEADKNVNRTIGSLIRLGTNIPAVYDVPDGTTNAKVFERILSLISTKDIIEKAKELDRMDVFTNMFDKIDIKNTTLISKLSTIDWSDVRLQPRIYKNSDCDLSVIKEVNKELYERTIKDYTRYICDSLLSNDGKYEKDDNRAHIGKIVSEMNDDNELLLIGTVIDKLIKNSWSSTAKRAKEASKLRNSFAREVERIGIIEAALGNNVNDDLIKPNKVMTPKEIINALKFNDFDAMTKSVRIKKNETIGEMLVRAKHLKHKLVVPPQQIEKEDRTVDELIDTTIKYNKMRTGRHGDNALEFIEQFNVIWENVPRFHLDAYNKLIVDEGEDSVLKPMFHATDAMAASFILRGGFIVNNDNIKAGRMLGNGIYFSNAIDKITAYVSQQAYRNTFGETTGYVLELEAVPGKQGTDYKSAGLGGDGIRSPEWCVFDYQNRIKVVKAYKVKIVNIKEVRNKERQRIGESNSDYDSRLLRKFLEEKNK